MAAFSLDDLRRSDVPPSRRSDTSSEAAQAFFAPDVSGAKADHRPPVSPVVIGGLVRAFEFVLLGASAPLAAAAYPPARDLPQSMIFFAGAMPALAVLIFSSLRLYRLSALRSPARAGLRVAGVWLAMMFVAMAGIFLLKIHDGVSRVWLVSWFAMGIGMLGIERGLVAHFLDGLTRQGRLERRTVIVGGGQEVEELIFKLIGSPDSDVKLLGVFDDRGDARSSRFIAGCPKLGTVDDLVTFARQTRVDLAIVTLPITAEARVLQMLRKLWVLPIDIRLSSHRNKLKLHRRSYSYIGEVAVLDVYDKPISDWDVIVKIVFDKIVGALALLAVSPIMIAFALAVKFTSRGPILFRQKRHGFNNEIIEVWKFRSMYVDRTDHTAQKQVTRDDPRVTPVGRFIRRTSLDELPQLFNVVFDGTLSLVGPRPHAVGGKAADRAYDEVVDGYFARHKVKPGITGWAQINGWRGATETPEKMQRRIEHDLYYIEHWSLLLDLYILAVTPFAVLGGENAF